MQTLFLCLQMMLLLVVGVGCKNNSSAAREAMSSLEERVKVAELQAWVESIVYSDNPSNAFTESGRKIPVKLLKDPNKGCPTIHLAQFDNGEWFILLDEQTGLEAYAIAVGKTNAHLPSNYKVWQMKPGIYYYHSHL